MSHGRQQDFIPVITASAQAEAQGSCGLSQEVPFLHGRSPGRSWTFLTVFFYSISANQTLSTEGQDVLHINEGDVQQSLHSLISCYPLWKAGPQR